MDDVARHNSLWSFLTSLELCGWATLEFSQNPRCLPTNADGDKRPDPVGTWAGLFIADSVDTVTGIPAPGAVRCSGVSWLPRAAPDGIREPASAEWRELK